MRRVLLLASFALCAPLWAQQAPKLEPLPEPPPPPPGVAIEPSGEAEIHITPSQNEQIEEFGVEGHRVVRVTTPGGAVYYLKDDPGIPDPDLTGGLLVRPFRMPQWLILEF
jgi:hypothetical protein